MSVKDMIKKSILESEMYNQAISSGTMLTIAVDMIIALLMGLLIYMVYKKFYSGVIFSKSFASTLVGMTVLTCMVTLAISTNIVISLGMVGALSIVRYRTAVKEPMDLLYLFWSITTGITVGASMYILALAGALIVILMIILLYSRNQSSNIFIAIIHYNGDETSDEIFRIMGKTKYYLKSKTMRGTANEMTLHISCRQDNLLFAERIRSLEQVKDIVLVQYNGEYHG